MEITLTLPKLRSSRSLNHHDTLASTPTIQLNEHAHT